MAGNKARTESHETLVTSAHKLTFNWSLPLKFASEQSYLLAVQLEGNKKLRL